MGQRLLPKGTEVLCRPTAGVGVCSSEGGIEPRPDDGTGDARRTCPKRSDSAASKTNRNSSTPGQHGRPPFRYSVTELILEWCGAMSPRPRCLRGDSRTLRLSAPEKRPLRITTRYPGTNLRRAGCRKNRLFRVRKLRATLPGAATEQSSHLAVDPVVYEDFSDHTRP